MHLCIRGQDNDILPGRPTNKTFRNEPAEGTTRSSCWSLFPTFLLVKMKCSTLVQHWDAADVLRAVNAAVLSGNFSISSVRRKLQSGSWGSSE